MICCLKIDRNVFETTLNKLNEFYADAEALSARTYCENCFACLTAYIIYLCMDTHYEKVFFVCKLLCDVFICFMSHSLSYEVVFHTATSAASMKRFVSGSQ